jgi:hypothetical protein
MQADGYARHAKLNMTPTMKPMHASLTFFSETSPRIVDTSSIKAFGWGYGIDQKSACLTLQVVTCTLRDNQHTGGIPAAGNPRGASRALAFLTHRGHDWTIKRADK